MSLNLYCKLFINSEQSVENLFERIRLYLRGVQSGKRTIQTDMLELDLIENSEYKPASQDFLFWRYYADIETRTDDIRSYIDCVRGMIHYLDEQGIFTVAACDFENELAVD